MAYAESQAGEDGKAPASKVSSTPVLHTLLSFLVTLNNLSTEGRIFYQKTQGKQQSTDVKLSYLLLSPTHAFSSIASSARAVILAGGTMSPFQDYADHLFPSLGADKITTLSCGHVIPSSNLCVWTLASTRPAPGGAGGGGGGGGGMDFEFSFQKRGDKAMLRELGVAILNICTVVPDGVVIFFPSYGYLDEVVAAWQERAVGGTTGSQSTWDRLSAKKAVFKETRGGSSDEVLEEYSAAILGTPVGAPKKSNGALLLSVVGGKMSEGINFSDRLGRCVVVIGLPYPNMHSPDWKARIEYIESTVLKRLSGGDNAVPNPTHTAMAKQASRDFYENACMRAVNQSIGRAIRHRGDYAAIVLLDRRFGTDRIRSKLPGWIRGGMVEGSEKNGLGQMMGRLSGFFRGKG